MRTPTHVHSAITRHRTSRALAPEVRVCEVRVLSRRWPHANASTAHRAVSDNKAVIL